MKIRTHALAATIALLGLSTGNRVSAQPIAPPRPANNAFGSLFGPGSYAVPNAGGMYGGGFQGGGFPGGGFPGGGMQGAGAFGINNALVPGFGGQRYYGPFAPYVLNMQPVVFNSRGHWYSQYYGHWYPNGLTNGTGVLSNGGRGGSSGLALLGGTQGPGTLGALGAAPPSTGGPQAPVGAVPGILGNPPGQNK